jgi:hypothetical protein
MTTTAVLVDQLVHACNQALFNRQISMRLLPRGASAYLQKIERWHQTMKNRVLLED